MGRLISDDLPDVLSGIVSTTAQGIRNTAINELATVIGSEEVHKSIEEVISPIKNLLEVTISETSFRIIGMLTAGYMLNTVISNYNKIKNQKTYTSKIYPYQKHEENLSNLNSKKHFKKFISNIDKSEIKPLLKLLLNDIDNCTLKTMCNKIRKIEKIAQSLVKN